MEQILIFDGQPVPLLRKLLRQLAGQLEDGLLLITPEPLAPGLFEELRRTLCLYAEADGFYLKQTQLSLRCIQVSRPQQVQELELQAKWLLACPHDLTQEETETGEPETVLHFSDPILALLEQFERRGLTLNEAEFEASLEQGADLPWLNEQALTGFLQSVLSPWLEQVDPEEPAVLARFRCLMDMAPWRSVHLPQQLRALLDQAIEKNFQDPRDPGAQMVLSLFRRRSVFQESELPVIAASYQDSNYLSLMPRVENWQISILVITYNRLKTLRRNVEAIQAQTYQDWNLILLDHGSTDGTSDYCQQLVDEDARIQLIKKPQNMGIQALSGYFKDFLDHTIQTELLVLCPDDDWLDPDHLLKLVSFFKLKPWLALVYGAYQLVDLQGVAHHQFGPLYPEACVVNPMIELQRLLYAGICPQALLLRWEVYRTFAHLDPTTPEGSPYGSHDFLAGIWLQSNYEVGHVPLPLTFITSDTSTANAQADLSPIWLAVLTILIDRYDKLYGIENYPKNLLASYYQLGLNQALHHLTRLLANEGHVDLPALRQNTDRLQAYAELWNQKILAANDQAGLFQHHNAYQPLPAPPGPVSTITWLQTALKAPLA